MALCSGRTSASTLSTPTRRAIAAAVRALSPVNHHPDAEGSQRGDGCGRSILDGVSLGDNAAEATVERYEHRRTRLFRKSIEAGLQLRRVDSGIVEQATVADGDLPAVHESANALAGDRIELGGLDRDEAFLPCSTHDGPGQWVLR